MSGLNIQNSRIQQKYSTFSGETPTIAPSTDHTDGTWTPTDIYVGEVFFNVVDDAAWFRSLNGIIPLTSGASYVSTYVNITGGTMTGGLVTPSLSATSITGTTIYSDNFNGVYYGDGSNLTGITATIFTGGTVSGNTIFTNNVDMCAASLSASTISGCGGELDIQGNLNVIGNISGNTFYGDGSGLTNLPSLTAVTLDNVLTQGDTSPNGNIVLTNGDMTLTNGTFFGDGSGLTNVPFGPTPTLDEVLTSGNTSTNGDILLTNGDVILGTGTYYGDGSGLTNLPTPTATTQTLAEVLVNGNSTGNNWIEVDITSSTNGVRSNDLTDRVIEFNPDGIDLYVYGSVSDAQTSIGMTDNQIRFLAFSGTGGFPDAEAYIDIFPNGNIGLEATAAFDINSEFLRINGQVGSFSGAQYTADFSPQFTDRSLVDKQYVDNATSGTSATLEQVLINGNITGENDIVVDSGQAVIFGTQAIADRYIGGNGAGDLIINNTNTGTTKENVILRTIGSDSTAIIQGISEIQFTSSTQTSLSGPTGSTWFDNTFTPTSNKFTSNFKYPNPGFADYEYKSTVETYEAGAGSFGQYGYALLKVEDLRGADQAFIQSLNDGNFMQNTFYTEQGGDWTNIIQKSDIIRVISPNAAFAGIEYGGDYSANFTDRTLVDKGYVDAAVSGSSAFSGYTYITEDTVGGTLVFSGANSITSTVTDGIDTSQTITTPSQVETTSTNGTKTSTETITPVSMTSMITDGTFTQSIYIDSQANKNVIEYIDGTDITRITTQDTGSNGEINMLVTDGTNTSNTQQKIDFITSYVYDSNTDITDIISLDPQFLGDGTGIKSVDNTNSIYSQTIYTPSEIILSVNDEANVNATTIDVMSTFITVEGTSPTFQGVEYVSDYSANFTNRTLVDKEYVDNTITGSTTASTISKLVKTYTTITDIVEVDPQGDNTRINSTNVANDAGAFVNVNSSSGVYLGATNAAGLNTSVLYQGDIIRTYMNGTMYTTEKNKNTISNSATTALLTTSLGQNIMVDYEAIIFGAATGGTDSFYYKINTVLRITGFGVVTEMPGANIIQKSIGTTNQSASYAFTNPLFQATIDWTANKGTSTDGWDWEIKEKYIIKNLN